MTLLLPIPPDRYDVEDERERNRLIEAADRENVKRNRSTALPDDVYLGAEIRDKGGMVFNVKHPEFGAVGDGTTDDSNAFNRAITAAGAAGGGVVYAPPSSTAYVFSSGSITLNQAGVTLLLGAATYDFATGRRIYVTAADCRVVGHGETTHIDYSDNTTSTTAPIRVEAARCYIADIKVTGGTGTTANNTSLVSLTTAATDCVVERVNFVDGAYGIASAAQRLRVRDCKFYSHNRDGIYLDSGSGQVYITGCAFDTCNTDESQNSSGIRINGNSSAATYDSGFLISDCYFPFNYGNHISVLNGGGGASNEMRTRDVGIINCTFLTCPANTPSGAEGEGIAATCDGLRVIGCYFRDIEHEAVNWTSPGGEPMSGCLISGCYVEDVTTETGTINAINGSAFEIVAGDTDSIAENFAVVGNVVVDTRGTSKTRAAVSLRQGAAGAIVRNGVVSGNVAINTSLGQVVELTEVDGGLETLNDLMHAGYPDRPARGRVITFGSADTTPSVAGNVIAAQTGTSTLTITDFDDGHAGQTLRVLSKGAITFDTTGTSLTGSSADIVTANGDTTVWFTENGSTWRLLGFVDASADNSGGA